MPKKLILRQIDTLSTNTFYDRLPYFEKMILKMKQSICDSKYPNLKLNKNYFNGDKTFFSVKYKKICKNLPLLCLYRLFLMHK